MEKTMAIAIDFKYNKKDYIGALEKRGFDVDVNGIGEVWVYNLNVIYNRRDTDKHLNDELVLEKKDNFYSYAIQLEDIDYFEIHIDI